MTTEHSQNPSAPSGLRAFALKLLPWCFFALFAIEVIVVFAPKSDKPGFKTREFGALPVLLNGRIQPFDSVGLNSLLQIRSTSDVPLEEIPSWQFWHHAKKIKSTDWLMEVMFKPQAADERPIFLIHHPDLLAELKLGDTGVEKSGLRYYTFNQLKPLMTEIWDQAGQAYQVDEKQRSPLQKQVVKLQNALFLYENLKVAVVPPFFDNFAAQYKDFEKTIGPGLAAIELQQVHKAYDTNALDKFWVPVSAAFEFSTNQYAGRYYPMVVPPPDPNQNRDNWGNIGRGLLDVASEKNRGYQPVRNYATMATAFSADDTAEFNKALVEYKSWLQQKFAPEVKKGNEEFFFNDTKPFLHATIMYIFAFVLAAFSLLTFSALPNLSESLRKSSCYIVILAGVVHTFGLIFRMYLEGRPPVTNLYSSAIFIGWGAMILGLVLERIYRVGIGVAVASLAGFVTLLIAHNLALGGDTMEMMRAVLDTNFWLATHVVVVTLGYASTFVAGLLAIIYVFLGVFTPLLSQKPTARTSAALSATVGLVAGPKAGIHMASQLSGQGSQVELGKSLGKMVYGIVCFATLFSFVGTVLGGIWADQSWGRFWGWDPKENGALIIVLWNAIILHARWGGMIRERGLMAMAIFGNIVTSFSWFGVNMLGVGLHSYGFMDAAFWWLIAFDVSQVLLIILTVIPTRYWHSFKRDERTIPTAVAA
ncbi:MAG: cytochrome c assembly protein [Verrucomicrobiales bacterium]|nr:cytochrome c assembly protein [Verrucomicrobiales bacterium]